MKQQDYHNSITVPLSANSAFENIINVAGWWTASFKGSAQKVNDTFSVNFGKTYVNFKVIETVPGKKAVWLVTDCYLDWINNKTEWKNTKIVWEMSSKVNETKIDMTHLGLLPEVECYNDCNKGWNFYIEKSLFKLLTENKGLPDQG